MRQHLEFPEEFYQRMTDSFYAALFDIIPGAEDLFTNVDKQKSMFTSMMSVLTESASDPAKLDRILLDLGVRHAHLGILPVHIRHAHSAFIRALHDAADDLTEEEEAFFSGAYKEIASKMNFVEKDMRDKA